MANPNSDAFDAYLLNSKTRKFVESKKAWIDVDKIEISGLEKTRESVVRRCFEGMKDAHEFAGLQDELHKSFYKCAHLDVLNKMETAVDVEKSKSDEDESSKGTEVLLKVNCEEGPAMGFNFSADVDNHNQFAFNTTSSIKNVIGVGDHWGLQCSLRPALQLMQNHVSMTGQLTLPQVISSSDHSGAVGAQVEFFGTRQLTEFLKQRVHGVTLGANISKDTMLSYTYQHRRLEPSASSPLSGDNNAGADGAPQLDLSGLRQEYLEQDSISSVSLVKSWDHIQYKEVEGSPFNYAHGMRGEALVEVATPTFGASTEYIKSELKADMYVPVPFLSKFGLSAGLHGAIGIAQASNFGQSRFGQEKKQEVEGGEPVRTNTKVQLSERFFQRARGYEKFLGKIDTRTGAPLGGNVYMNFMARLQSPVPHAILYETTTLHTHAFVQATNAVNCDLWENDGASNATRALWNGVKTSAGVGFFIRLPFGRLEFNYCVPMNNTTRSLHPGQWRKFQIFFETNHR